MVNIELPVKKRSDLEVLLLGSIQSANVETYSAINCGVACNCSMAVSHWNAWASDTQGEQLRCTAADALPTIYRLSDGTIEFGEFVTVPTNPGSIYLAASNTLCIRTSPPIAAHRLPLFLASTADRTVTYNVEIEMLLDRLVDLPDSQALRYYGDAMEKIVSGASFDDPAPLSEETFASGQSFPIEIESNDTFTPGVVQLLTATGTRKWAATLYLLGRLKDHQSPQILRRTSAVTIVDSTRTFAADIARIRGILSHTG